MDHLHIQTPTTHLFIITKNLTHLKTQRRVLVMPLIILRQMNYVMLGFVQGSEGLVWTRPACVMKEWSGVTYVHLGGRPVHGGVETEGEVVNANDIKQTVIIRHCDMKVWLGGDVWCGVILMTGESVWMSACLFVLVLTPLVRAKCPDVVKHFVNPLVTHLTGRH